MDFKFSHEEELFRQEIREFLNKELVPDWVGHIGPTMGQVEAEDDKSWEFFKNMAHQLAQRGWLSLTWPKEYGGQARSHIDSFILREEMAYRGAPGIDGVAIKMIGPTLIDYGTEEQKGEHLPPIAKGEKFWCELFSEPNAGSDLASLQTTGVEDGNCFIINGQKVWATLAHRADWGFMLARTDTQLARHRGLSFFLIDMTTPGITIRPIKNMLGAEDFNEVFFEDVRVPKQNMVGEKNGGWYIAMALLSYERADIEPIGIARSIIDDITSYIKIGQAKEGILARDQLAKQMIAEMATNAEIARLICYKVAWQQDKGIANEWDAAMARAYQIKMIQHTANSGMQLLGLYGLLDKDSRWAPLRGKIERLYLNSVGGRFASGTAEIHKTIIAIRGLGLPRD